MRLLKAERLAEFQEARLRILAGDMPEEPVSAAFIELIDALIAERARAEKAEAGLENRRRRHPVIIEGVEA